MVRETPHLQLCVKGFGGLQLKIVNGIIQKADALSETWHRPVLSCYTPQKILCQKRRKIHHLLEHILAVLCKQFSSLCI